MKKEGWQWVAGRYMQKRRDGLRILPSHRYPLFASGSTLSPPHTGRARVWAAHAMQAHRAALRLRVPARSGATAGGAAQWDLHRRDAAAPAKRGAIARYIQAKAQARAQAIICVACLVCCFVAASLLHHVVCFPSFDTISYVVYL